MGVITKQKKCLLAALTLLFIVGLAYFGLFLCNTPTLSAPKPLEDHRNTPAAINKDGDSGAVTHLQDCSVDHLPTHLVGSKERNTHKLALQVPVPFQSTPYLTLTQETIESVEKFVIFIGYPRSGHSIIASMMDAHPNMIISHEYMLLRKMTVSRCRQLQSKEELFQTLFQVSQREAYAIRENPYKGYTLGVDSQWQGTFNGSLKVIGDKSGGQTVTAYMKDKHRFEKELQHLHRMIGIPIRVIHVVRNPYDIIATAAIYATDQLHDELVGGRITEESLKDQYQAQVTPWLREQTKYFLGLAEGINEMITALNLTVLEIHGVDFVRDPKETLSRICSFLDLPCPQKYLQACYDKAYKNVSRTRNLVFWPEDVLADVKADLKRIPFLRRYSFDD